MKIEIIRAENFLGLPKVELVPKAPVVLVLGDNESGKSSLRDTLEWGITGLLPSRRVTTKKGGGAVASALPCSVALSVGGVAWERNPAGASLQEGQLAARFPTEMVRNLLNAWRFVDLPLKERRDLVRAITAKPEKIAEAVKKLVLAAGLPETTADYVSATARADLDGAEKHACDMRVDFKRKRDALPAAPTKSVTVAGKSYDLSSIDTAGIDELLAEIKTERDKLIGRHAVGKLSDSPGVIEARLEAADREIFGLSAANVEAIARHVADAQAAEKKLNAARDAYSQAKAAKAAAEVRVNSINTLQDACPMCGQSVTAKIVKGLLEREQKDIDKAAAIMTTAEVDGKSAKADIARHTQAKTDAENAIRRRDELAKQMADDKESLEVIRDFSSIEKAIDELDTRAETGRQLRDAKRSYDQALAMDSKRADYTKAIDSWDAVAQGLGPKGEVRKLAAEGFDLAAVKAHANVLLGRDIEVDGEWNITVGKLGEGMLSESAKYRLGACFAAALAVASGLGFLVLDRADVLSTKNRGALLTWLEGLAGQLDTVIVLATSDAEVESTDWMDVRRIEAGALSS